MTTITVQSIINAPVSKLWNCFTEANQVINWNFVSPDWHCHSAENNLVVGGEFHYTMAAKDGSFSFDFWGTFNTIEKEKNIGITLGGGRKMYVSFEEAESSTIIIEIFEAEKVNPIEMQQEGWQAILDNFKNYVESY